MKKIRCPNCGAFNDEENIFCVNCEEILSNSLPGKAYLEKKAKEKKFERLRIKILLIMLGILLICGIIGYYLFLCDKVQGIWSGEEGNLMLQTSGVASVDHASFAENGSYKWKLYLWNTLQLTSQNDSGVKLQYKLNPFGDQDTLELRDVSDKTVLHVFKRKSFIIY